MSDWQEKLGQDLLAGKTEEVKQQALGLLAEGIKAETILAEAMMPAMDRLGRKFSDGEVFLPELLLAADTMKGAFEVLGPALIEAGAKEAGTLIIGTVRGDIHDLGKNLVKIMFEGAGFKVHDLGCDVAAEKFCEAYKSARADLVGLSSLLTTTMMEMKSIVDSLKAVDPDIKILVGGAPLTQDYADRIGAAGFAPDAPTAVSVGKMLLGL